MTLNVFERARHVASLAGVLWTSFALTTLMPCASQAQGINVQGMLDCGTWVQARSEKRAVAVEHYLLGLLNGMSIGSGIEFWRAKGTLLKREQVYLWMDNYCRQTPLSDVLAGAHKLMNEQSDNAYQRFQDRN